MHVKWFLGIPAVVLALAACGGGGSGGSGAYGNPVPGPTPAPAGLPVQQNVAGSAAWVSPVNDHTLYYLDVDTPSGGTCTGGCLGVWPVFAPSAGTVAQNGFTIVARSDGSGKQIDYHSHPLYYFSGDGGPDEANGNGIPLAGGHWHVARP